MSMKGIFEFNKTLLERLEEIKSILKYSDDSIPASKVRQEWSKYVEIGIEPTSWQAFWKIPRVICEDLKIKHPTIVIGTVGQVLFDGLKAEFTIQAVNDDIDIPQEHEVFLEDLWPTQHQTEETLNIERTAEIIDRLRFFYQHIWMPWDYDNDDDHDWAAKHLEKRMKFYCDIVNKNMSRSLLSHIRILCSEAQYIQQCRENLEMDLEEDDDEDEQHDAEEFEKTHVTKLMRLHLRLNIIKNEFEMLENPDIRKVYEIIKFPGGNKNDMTTSVKNIESSAIEESADFYIVSSKGTLKDTLAYLNKATEIIGNEKIVQLSSTMQEALDSAKSSSKIYLPSGQHSIRFLNYLNGGGAIKAISETKLSECTEKDIQNLADKAQIFSFDEDSILLAVDGDYTFENLILFSDNVRTAVLIKKGNVIFKNCYIYDSQKSSSKKGVVIFGGSSVNFEDCIIRNFATAIYSNCDTKISLKNTIISDCFVGVELLEKSQIVMQGSHIKNCHQYGIMLEMTKNVMENNVEIIDDFNKIDRKEISIAGNCSFQNNRKGNMIINMKTSIDAFNDSCFYDDTISEEEETALAGLRKRKNENQLI